MNPLGEANPMRGAASDFVSLSSIFRFGRTVVEAVMTLPSKHSSPF
jgi:hypothetical protein